MTTTAEVPTILATSGGLMPGERRRWKPGPLLHQLIGDGTLPDGYATDDGVGLLYRGTDLSEAVTERRGAAAYRIRRHPDGTVEETMIEPQVLPGAAN